MEPKDRGGVLDQNPMDRLPPRVSALGDDALRAMGKKSRSANRAGPAERYEKALLTALLSLPQDRFASAASGSANVGLSSGLRYNGGTSTAQSESHANSSSGKLEVPPALPATAPSAMLPRTASSAAVKKSSRPPVDDPEVFLRTLTGLPPVPARSHGEDGFAVSRNLGLPSRALTADAIAAAARLPAGSSALAARVADFGNYPLATRERVQVATLERLKKEQLLREKKMKADELRAKFEAKQAAKEAAKPKKHGSDDEYDDDGTDDGSGSVPGAMSKFLRDPKTGKIRLKKAARLIQMSAAFAKPPEQKVKQEIKALQSSAHKQALKKLLYGWATVQLAFRVMASEDYTWPAAPEGSEMPLPVAPPNFDGDDDGGAVASPLSEFDEQEGSGSPPSASSTGEGAAAAETAGTAVASTNHSSAPVPYNFKGGIKGTLGLRDLFGLLGHGLGLLPSEQAYVMDELVLASANEKGHSLKEASTLASKIYAVELPEYHHGHHSSSNGSVASRASSHKKKRKRAKAAAEAAAKARASTRGNLSSSTRKARTPSAASAASAPSTPVRGATPNTGRSRRTGSPGGGETSRSRVLPSLLANPPGGLAFERAPPSLANRDLGTPQRHAHRNSQGGFSDNRGGSGDSGSPRSAYSDGGVSGSDDDEEEDDNPYRGYTPLEVVEAQAEEVQNAGWPAIVTYKDFEARTLKTVEPAFVAELWADIAKAEAYKNKVADADRATQMALIEKQAQRRAPLVAELSRKLDFPPTKTHHKPKDGRGPTVVVPTPHAYNTRARVKQLSALLKDGGAVLELLLGEGGGLGSIMNNKRAQLGQANALGSAAISNLHIPLAAGRPYGGIKECVLTAAKYGSGLQGLSPAECVETLWQYCAERIQSCHRGLLPRRQQGGALRMWREREKAWKRRVFKAWWNAARNTLELRYRCKSPFKFWRKYVDKMLVLHHLFAKCFWPIYIWRKTTREAILERQKANLLKNLYVCSFTLHVFRAWKKFALQKMATKKRCDDHYAAFQAKKATRSFHFWRRCCHRDKLLAVNWLRRGMRTHDDKELEVLWRCVTVWRYWRDLQRIVAVRASQFWRVISADRALAAAIATADVKAKKRKTRKQRDAKALAAAQKEQELARQKLFEGFPALPRLRQLPWGKGLPMRLHTLCAKMLPYMDKELVRECGQRHLCYWREGPRFFKNMRDMVLLRKKSTVALRKYGRQTKLLVFLEWQKEIKRKRASREARKEERAAARLVAKQRAVALATARAQGQKFLIAQLEAEQATADKAAQLKSFARRERLQAAGRSSAVIEEDNLESDHSSDDDDELGEIAEERAAEAREAELVAKAAAAVASPHKASSSSLLQAFSSEKKEEPLHAKPLLLHGVAQTAQFRQKGMLWRQKAKLAAKPMVGSILDHDRAARAEQLKRFHNLVAKVERESLALEKERDAHVDEHADWVNDQAASTLALSEFFEDEAGKMDRAGNREVKYVSELKVHTARTILHLLNTVRHNSEKALDYLIAWRYFRALRVPYYDRKAFHLRNKQKLRNWLRHCVRLQRLDRGMPRFRKLRVLWRCWHKLLRHAENRRKHRTPALRDHLVALAARAGKFNTLLQARGVCGELPVPMEELHPKTTDLRACLLRWATYAADACHARATSRLVAWRAQYATRRRALQGLMLAGLGMGKATQTLERAARKAKDAEFEAIELAEQQRADSLDYGESYKDLPSYVQSGNTIGRNSTAGTAAIPAVVVAVSSGTSGASSVNQSAAGSVRSSINGTVKPGAEEGPHDRAAKRRKRALIGRNASRAKTTYPGPRQRNSSGDDGDGSGEEPESASSYGGVDEHGEEEGSNQRSYQARSSSSSTTVLTVRSQGNSVKKKAGNESCVHGQSTTEAPPHEFDGIMRDDDVPVGRTNFQQVVKSVTANMAAAAFLDAASGKLGSGHLNHLFATEGPTFGKGEGAFGWEGREGEARWPYAPPLPKTYAEQRLQEDLSAWRDMFANKRARCVATLTRRCNRRRAAEVAFKARNGPSFKKYVATLRADASRRLALERSLLLDAFVTRGKLGFEDYSVASMPQTAQPEESQSSSDNKKNKKKKGVAAAGVDAHLADATSSQDVAAEEPPMPGETSFVDKVVWGGYALGEVTVFTTPGLGIVGVCLTYRGDGPGQVELLPQGGLRAPHGQATENIATFKLEQPYEHVYAVTMVVSSGSFEALQCHVAAPDGTHLRDSPLLGRPFSADARRVVLRGNSSKDMLVGLRGRFSPHRVTALGLQMRHVTSARHVFSCHWTPSKVEATANATLAKHAHVLAEARSASLAKAQDALSGGGDERAGQKRSSGSNTGPDGMPLPPKPVQARPSSAEKLLAQRSAAREALLQKAAEEEAAAKAAAEKEAAEKAAADALEQEGGAEMSPLKGGEVGSVGAASSSTIRAAAGAAGKGGAEAVAVSSSRPSTGAAQQKDEPNFLVGSGIAAGYGLKEQWRVAIEAGKEAKKDAREGNWEKYAPGKTLRTAEEEEVQVAEFVAVLRMRSVDVSAAAARSEAFVRRMWSGTVCDQHHPETHPLRTLGLITCLGRWLFRALCFSLAPDPPCSPDIPDRLEARSLKFLHAAVAEKKSSGDLHHRALEADAAPRTWATFGLMSPADRAAEANFRAQLAEWRHESSRLAAKAARYKEEGEGYAAAALALRPQLRNTFAAHVYYRKRLELARTQRRMEAEFGRQYFTATLNAVAAGKARSTLTRQQLEELAHAIEPLPPGLGAPGQVDF